MPKQVNFYNEPYYPPGYCGYSPQFPFKYGETYGKTTSRLLTDPTVAKSKRSVLAEIRPKSESCNLPHLEENREKKSLRLQKQSWGDVKLSERMVPGYTGYIPKKEDHFGSTYGDVCRSAIYDFDKDQGIYDSKRKELLTPKKSMVKVKQDAKPYVSLKQVHHSVSPYFMNTFSPDKTFMSGYTGFIPRARARFAIGYPLLTMDSLKDFTRCQQIEKASARKPVVVNPDRGGRQRADCNSDLNQPIYVDNGLLPNYTGYLPSDKFRFGITFGTSSRYYHALRHKSNSLQPIF